MNIIKIKKLIISTIKIMKSQNDGAYKINPLFAEIQPVLSPKEKKYFIKKLIFFIIIFL
jgi:hypothetical protein